MGTIGNTFDVKTQSFGHATKVWRSLRHVFPAGGVISADSVTAFYDLGKKIPAGTPVKYDASTKTLVAYTDAQITSADDITALGINAYLQEDCMLESASTVATGTAVYAGEIYEYMFDSAVVAKLKTLTTVPQIVWVL